VRVLVADDDRIALEAAAHALVAGGFDVTPCHDGAEALEFARSGDFRLVLTDWVMPNMDGLELCRQIRDGHLPAYVYIILLTSRESTGDVVQGLSAGADDFITKPFVPAELLARVRNGRRILSIETRDVAIFAMARLAESRDPETGRHLERVREYSRVLAHDLVTRAAVDVPRPEDFVRLIYLTSPLHDIGKVGVPDCVLLKPEALNEREFEIMKTHTTIGAETIASTLRLYPGVGYLEMARDIARSHHERFDGTGYPEGCAGEDIPLCGRILALADVYDALTSKRVYKKAYSHDVARSVILDESGSHFDPAVVEAFVNNELEFQDILHTYREDGAPAAALVEPSAAGNESVSWGMI